MSKYRFLLFAGLFISILPYLGFPSSWDTFMYTIGGLSIAVVSVLARTQFKNGHKEVVVEQRPAYVESTPLPPRRVRPPRPKSPKVMSHGDVVAASVHPPTNMAE